jgi:thermitase
LLNVKVADDRGRCNAEDLASGIIWATDRGADVINISIELKDTSAGLEDAIGYAWDRGVLIVAAAGNNSGRYAVYPAFYEETLAVTALKEDDGLSPLANGTGIVDVAAPGYQIFSTLPGNNYGYETGTSFAAANVSGLAALLFGLVSDNNGDNRLNDEVYELIISSSQTVPAGGTFWGKVDAAQIAARHTL